MGKVPYLFTDSEETEDTGSSMENVKKKKKFSILKLTSGNVKKKKCKLHSKSEPDDSDYRSRSRSRSNQKVRYNLRGILKYDKDKESSDDDDDIEPVKRSQDRCLVGRVPQPVGANSGRGGGLSIIVKKNISSLQAQSSVSSTKRRKSSKRLARKRSY